MEKQKDKMTPEILRELIQSSHPHILRKYESIGELIIDEETSGRMPGVVEIELKDGTYIDRGYTEIKGRPRSWFGDEGNWDVISSIVGYYAGFNANGTLIGAPDEIILAQVVRYLRNDKENSSEFYGSIKIPMARITSAKIIKKGNY